MNLIELLAYTNGLLDQLIVVAPKVIAFAAITATFIPESTPFIGAFLHKAALNIGKATNKIDD